MRTRLLFLLLILNGLSAGAQAALVSHPASIPTLSEADVLSVPKAFRDFIYKTTFPYSTSTGKAKALATSFFSAPKDGGLGITYNNDKTRTVEEVWNDRKANCISLTATYVAACKLLGIRAGFAEEPSVNHWIRRGQLVCDERHMLATIQLDPINVIIADFGGIPASFSPWVTPVSESRFRALFHSNRSVENLNIGDMDSALVNAKAAVADDAKSEVGWNVLGVVQSGLGDLKAAEASFRSALSANPSNGVACGNLDDLLRRVGRTEEAAKFRKLGMKLRDRDPYFHAFLAREAMAEGRNDDARGEIRHAIRLQRMEPDFYLVLAQVELNQGERAAAAKAVEKAIHWSLPDQRKRMESKLDLIRRQA